MGRAARNLHESMPFVEPDQVLMPPVLRVDVEEHRRNPRLLHLPEPLLKEIAPDSLALPALGDVDPQDEPHEASFSQDTRTEAPIKVFGETRREGLLPDHRRELRPRPAIEDGKAPAAPVRVPPNLELTGSSQAAPRFHAEKSTHGSRQPVVLPGGF